ncbi:hypothetical protein J2S66_000929 [Saccharothrix longispora]|uniref:Uncharacterized protein n=1 Tax=Saccharothrix longispora TaxID=33920 RepID=A0ABU1PPI2_9PSEU|nr:hypothetical protein [Saccharothrix longispora]
MASLAEALRKVLLEVRVHAGGWATVNPTRPGGVHEHTVLERRNKVHELGT